MSFVQIYNMRKFLPLIIAVLAILIPLMLPSGCANTTEAPSGGDKDTIPPYIVNINPLPGATGVPTHGQKFVFSFNEYVKIKTASNIVLSPPHSKRPISKIKGRDVIVSFEEDLLPNTTYTISFTDAIADTNEDNMFAGYTYVFSTGEKIDSMMITGTIRDCNTLAQIKGATVLLHKDLSDSAIFKTLPYAATKTDDWGYFTLPYIQDSSYRLYAIKDANNNYLLDPDTELVGFLDTLVRPILFASDTTREMLRYDMLDTLSCLARSSEYELVLFREVPSKQLIVNQVRTAERSAYLTFMAQGAIIDSLKINSYQPNQIISQFNIQRDCLEIWVNSRRAAPDTMRISVDYRKTDSTGVLSSMREDFNLTLENDKRTYSKRSRRDLKQTDTSCVFTLEAKGELVEQNGIIMEFSLPIIYENFDSLKFSYINPRQVKTESSLNVERDSLNLRRYVLRPKEKFQKGYEYFLKVPYRSFRNINGFWSDSTEVKFSLPSSDELSSLETVISGVDGKYIVDLLNEKRNSVLRSYIIESDCSLLFPYLKEGKYCIRITEDRNQNSIIDTGSVLEHRQPEKVVFYEVDGDSYLMIPASAELSQNIDLSTLFEK